MRRLGWTALVFLLATGLTAAQNLTTLNYQGHLTDGKGNPITSPVLMKFTLCSGGDPTNPSSCGSGTVAYTEMATITPGSGGLFTYRIGTGHMPPDLGLGVFSPTQPLYLEVSIGTEVLLPRKLVVLNQDTAASASYLLDSLAAAGASGLATTGDINTGTQYNIGGHRVLSVPGDGNTFVGVGAGQSHTTGVFNAFFGTDAGVSNTTGFSNAFFGAAAGRANTTGGDNAFFGTDAGLSNTTGFTNAFFGTSAGFSNTTGFRNAFFGTGAGRANTTGGDNAFFGAAAGSFNTTGGRNAFFGIGAGRANTTGFTNAFFGADAGAANTTGSNNAFFGTGAGVSNTTGFTNAFFGTSAGFSNTTGGDNAFFGTGAGSFNTTGGDNVFFGAHAGSFNTTGRGNAFFGIGAGGSNTTEDNNTFLGASSNGAAGITNATAIGAGAVVTQSNAVVLGNNADIGIGTSAPQAKLHLQGGHLLVGSPGMGLILRSPDGATCRLLTIDNAGNMVLTPIDCPSP